MARKTGSHSEITGPKVYDAAVRLIALQGYAAVSMRQIAGEVGVQAGALYNYISDKQTLLFDLMRVHMEELLEAASALDTRLSAVDRLRDFATFHIHFHAARRDLVFISYMELRNLTDENFAAVEALRRKYEVQLETILNDGQKDGSFYIVDTAVTTRVIIAMVTGITNWFDNDGELTLKQVSQIYCNMVLGCVGVNAQA